MVGSQGHGGRSAPVWLHQSLERKEEFSSAECPPRSRASCTAPRERVRHEDGGQGAAGDGGRRHPRDDARRVEPQRHHQVAQPVSRSLGQLQQRRAMSDARGRTPRPRQKVASQRRRQGGLTERCVERGASGPVPRNRAPPPSSTHASVYRGALDLRERGREGAVKSPLQAL